MTPEEREFELLKLRLLVERQSGMPRWKLTPAPDRGNRRTAELDSADHLPTIRALRRVA